MKTKAKELLSTREQEVLAQVLEGKTSRQIAYELFVSEDTVITHRKNINKKLDAKNIVDLFKFSLPK